MTPETYLKRRRALAERDAECCPLAAEDVFPCGRSRACDRNSDCGCGCGETEPPYQGPEDRDQDTGCCCKASMAEGLRLLCGECLSSLVNFGQFFFLTDSLAVGSTLEIPDAAATDNIAAPAATLERFSPCNCDLLDVSGTAYVAVPGSTGVVMEDVDQLSLCALKAVAFQIDPSVCDDECEDTNYRRAVRAIRRAIRAEGGDTGACGTCEAHCDCDDCCCAAGVVRELSTRNLSRQATLAAGPLVLRNVTVLGSIGSALVLADEALSRFYLVCANAVEAIG